MNQPLAPPCRRRLAAGAEVAILAAVPAPACPVPDRLVHRPYADPPPRRLQAKPAAYPGRWAEVPRTTGPDGMLTRP
jgi:hypothetical protein